jgi:hypothetical protein
MDTKIPYGAESRMVTLVISFQQMIVEIGENDVSSMKLNTDMYISNLRAIIQQIHPDTIPKTKEIHFQHSSAYIPNSVS